MEYFEKKITYLRGLCDGSDFPAESEEGKIFHGILDVLDDMAFMLETFMEMQTEIPCPGCGATVPIGSADMDDLKF